MKSIIRPLSLAIAFLFVTASAAYAGGTIEGKVSYKSPRYWPTEQPEEVLERQRLHAGFCLAFTAPFLE